MSESPLKKGEECEPRRAHSETSEGLLIFYFVTYFTTLFFTGKRSKAKERETAEDEMIRQHHQFNGHEFEQTQGDSGGQRSLACSSPWGHKESDITSEQQQHVRLTSIDDTTKINSFHLVVHTCMCISSSPEWWKYFTMNSNCFLTRGLLPTLYLWLAEE